MTQRESLLADFDHETAVTRRLLERLPEGELSWTPHERSFTLGQLATHLGRLVSWGRSILNQDFYDLASGPADPPAAAGTPAAALEIFDTETAAVRARLASCLDAELAAAWELRRGTQTMMSMPRLTAMRRFVLHHLVHHRGQLSVYLRLRGVPLPPIYGPTADERM